MNISRTLTILRRSFSSNALHKTCLYDLHLKYGGKMVDFAGFAMPVQYSDQGIVASHKHTRSHCSIFDVSHMLQSEVHGKDRIHLMEGVTVADIQGLQDNQGTLSVFTNDNGGILDDLIVTKTNQGFLYVVSNAGCREQDKGILKTQEKVLQSQGRDVSVVFRDDLALIALQGPDSAQCLQQLSPAIEVNKMSFMTTTIGDIGPVGDCRITRCGYTGEDGFEISVDSARAEELVATLLAVGPDTVRLAGLGARDSLRLEAGLCLYGNDIDEKTTPVEAGLAWTIGKRRRQEADFPGSQTILRQLKDKPEWRRVGIISERGPPARAHSTMLKKDSEDKVGVVTSGCPSPTLGVNIAMGYVNTNTLGTDKEIDLLIRNKQKVPAKIVKLPFVKTNYHFVK